MDYKGLNDCIIMNNGRKHSNGVIYMQGLRNGPVIL